MSRKAKAKARFVQAQARVEVLSKAEALQG
jgi:hypothetical protein